MILARLVQLSNAAEAMPGAELKKLLADVEAQLRKMGRAIYSGAMRVDPYRKSREIPCAFCDYRAACRIDPWTHRYRVLRASETSSSPPLPSDDSEE